MNGRDDVFARSGAWNEDAQAVLETAYTRPASGQRVDAHDLLFRSTGRICMSLGASVSRSLDHRDSNLGQSARARIDAALGMARFYERFEGPNRGHFMETRCAVT